MAKSCYIEEYGCGCTNLLDFKNEAVGYCPTHGEDALRIYKIADEGDERGLAK